MTCAPPRTQRTSPVSIAFSCVTAVDIGVAAAPTTHNEITNIRTRNTPAHTWRRTRQRSEQRAAHFRQELLRRVVLELERELRVRKSAISSRTNAHVDTRTNSNLIRQLARLAL
jgi:hypothetical protein